MKIAQLSDLHFTYLTFNPFRLLSKRALGYLNWLFLRKNQFSESQLEPLASFFKELKVDFVLFGGDFTTTSLKEEFEKAKQWVSQIQIPWFAIPGNHDHYTKWSCRNKYFYRYFTNQRDPIDHPAHFFNLKKDRIEAHRLKDRWWLIALDTAIATKPYSSQGFFSEKLESYFVEMLKLLPKEDHLIVINHFPFFQNDKPRHNLIRGDALQKVLNNFPQIRLYLHGHTHRHTVADLQVKNLPIVLDSGSCAQGKKGAWNLIDINETHCKISTYCWNHKWVKKRTEEFLWNRKSPVVDKGLKSP